ncbi:MAG TPA: hypothetical protein VJZ73_13355 [Methylomirabilota bacterium]|nr:hypothetical protein [Methylomirabilota bacterium]
MATPPTATLTLEIERPNFDELADDRAELEALESMLMGLPDELVIAAHPRAGKSAAARFRLDMSAALRAMHELLDVVARYPEDSRSVDVQVAGDMMREPLKRWRAARAKIAERLGAITR